MSKKTYSIPSLPEAESWPIASGPLTSDMMLKTFISDPLLHGNVAVVSNGSKIRVTRFGGIPMKIVEWRGIPDNEIRLFDRGVEVARFTIGEASPPGDGEAKALGLIKE